MNLRALEEIERFGAGNQKAGVVERSEERTCGILLASVLFFCTNIKMI
jgi:hypothetical protein